MHEVSIAEGILAAVNKTLENEPLAKVTSVMVSIGELAGVETEALLFAWDSVVRDTPADHSKLVINHVPGEAWCMQCARNVPLHRHGDACPYCGGYQLMAVKGHELKVDSLEADFGACSPQSEDRHTKNS